jgi:phenylacetate-CoA ligase
MYEENLETMKLDDIKILQNERIVKMVRYAHDNVPFYKRKFKVAGITPDEIKSSSDLNKVPFTVKDDLRDHYPYGILAIPRENVVRFHSSSGTTGIPTVVSYTQNDLDTWSSLMARAISRPGVSKGDSTGNTKRQLKIAKDMRSTVIACTPSYALYLAEAALEEGYKPLEDFDMKYGLFGAEAWSEEARKKIQDSLGLGAYDCYWSVITRMDFTSQVTSSLWKQSIPKRVRCWSQESVEN